MTSYFNISISYRYYFEAACVSKKLFESLCGRPNNLPIELSVHKYSEQETKTTVSQHTDIRKPKDSEERYLPNFIQNKNQRKATTTQPRAMKRKDTSKP
jgi:hypothetical protein